LGGFWLMVVWLVVTPWLMVTPFALIALKFEGWDWGTNWHRYMVLTCGLLALVSLQWIGIAIFMPFYIVLSLFLYERKPKS
jgi:phosphatidylserine synthase